MREQTVGRPYGGRVLCGARTSLLSQRSAPRPETQERKIVTLPLGPKFQAERKTRKFLHPTTSVCSSGWFGLVCPWVPPHDRDGLVSGRFAPRSRMQGPDDPATVTSAVCDNPCTNVELTVHRALSCY